MDECDLAEHLITYDTSHVDGLRTAAGFIKGWLESREIKVSETVHGDLPVLEAETGRPGGPTVIFHAHFDVVPAHPGQFVPRIEGDRLIGRGSYDMKGALAAMMCVLRDVAANPATAVQLRFLCTPDEEAEDIDLRSTDEVIKAGFTGDFAITGEPTDLHVGVQAKGVLACRLGVSGRSAHGSTPWLGDNAVLKTIEVFRRIESLPFSRESSELFDRPSINLGRILGGDAFNKVPDFCVMDVDVRYLPTQNPDEILAQIAALDDVEVIRYFGRPPVSVPRDSPYVEALVESISRSLKGEALSVGRDGASDAVSFLEAGIPAVEFGPEGAGHHGPEEWVSISSLMRYRAALTDFIYKLPEWLSSRPI